MAPSLVDELQLDAANPVVSVATLLRKGLMVASKLELSDVPAWIDKELSGYNDGDALPPYRIVHGSLMARGPRGWVPVQFPRNDLQEMVSEKQIYNSIAEIEVLSKEAGKLTMGFPPELQQLLQTTFEYETEFRCFLEKTRLDAILDEVRNQVLRWAIALDRAGVRGNGLAFTPAEKEKANMAIHANNLTIGVVGNVGGKANVATGVRPRAGSIDVRDIQKLVAELGTYLSSVHQPPADINEILAVINELNLTSTKSIETGKVRQVLDRALGLLGKAGETVMTVGIKTWIEAWMRNHGIGP